MILLKIKFIKTLCDIITNYIHKKTVQYYYKLNL